MENEMMYDQMGKPKKKSKAGLLIAIIVIIIVAVGLYVLLGQNGKTSPDINTDVNHQNVDVNEPTDVDNNQNGDLNEPTDIDPDTNNGDQSFTLKEHYEIDMQSGNGNLKLVLQAVNENKERYDFNLTTIQTIEDENELYPQIMTSIMLSAFIAPMYGPGLNREISNQTYNMYKDNNMSIKEQYEMHSEKLDLDQIDENISSQEFFTLNQKLVLDSLKLEDENSNDSIYYILDNLLDQERDMKNILYTLNFDYNGEITQSVEFAYRGDEQKLHTLVYDINGDEMMNMYDQNSQWITLTEWVNTMANQGNGS